MKSHDALAHVVTGDGPPLVLLNGGLMTYAAWDPLAGVIAQTCRLVRCDFRGQLLSPGAAPATLEGHADDVLTVMDEVGLESAHIAGASLGALDGLVLAARAPSRVRSLMAMNATDRITGDMAKGSHALRAACGALDGGRIFDLVAASTWSEAFLAAQAPVLAARRQAMGLLPRAWFTGLAELLSAVEGLDLRPVLPRIVCPTLLLGGEADKTFPIEHSRELAARIPQARLVVVPGGSHGLCIEHAPKVVELLLGFVAEVEQLGART